MKNRKERRRPGDRRDGKLLRGQDALHVITPILYPNRCDNEAFISETIDLTKTNEYLKKKNEGAEYHYNLFQVVVSAALKTLILRPKMNRFIQKSYVYQRNDVTASFVVKKQFADNGDEGLAVLKSLPSDNINNVHQKIYDQITSNRGSKAKEKDQSSKAMDAFASLPLWVCKALIRFVMLLDKNGHVPKSLIETDPYYCSIVLTNLGSIGLDSGYHHLVNWGTNSVFIAIGKIKKRPFYNEDGTFDMRDSVTIGLTIDERIADGYYYSKTVKLLKKLIEEPELLEERFDAKVKLESK